MMKESIQKFRPDACLAEAVIVSGKSYFAIAAQGGITLEKSLDDFIPPSAASYMNRPYVFKSKEEFDEIVEKAKHETLDTLYLKVKGQWRKYSTDDGAKISLALLTLSLHILKMNLEGHTIYSSLVRRTLENQTDLWSSIFWPIEILCLPT